MAEVFEKDFDTEVEEVITGSLLDFLTDNPVDGITEVIHLRGRLENFPITIRALTYNEVQEARERSQKTSFNKKGVATIKNDNSAYNATIILAGVVEPDFRDAQAIRKAGCTNPTEFINRVLLPAEQDDLTEAIGILSGYETEEELEEDVKKD